DVRVQEGGGAGGTRPLADVDDALATRLRPALDRDLGAAAVDGDDDVAGMTRAHVREELRVQRRTRPDDRPTRAGVEHGIDGAEITETAADLDRQRRDGENDLGDHGGLL